MNDQECIESIRQGGQARIKTIEQLYRTYARRFLGYMVNNRVAREQAEELVQDVFIKIYRQCDTFRGETSISSWMWSIVRNTLIDHTRKPTYVPTEESVMIMLVGVAEDSPEEGSTELEECVRRGFAAFAAQDSDRAQVLKLVALEGWAIHDVAELIKRNAGATREYLYQCRKKLKVFLQPCLELLTD